MARKKTPAVDPTSPPVTIQIGDKKYKLTINYDVQVVDRVKESGPQKVSIVVTDHELTIAPEKQDEIHITYKITAEVIEARESNG